MSRRQRNRPAHLLHSTLLGLVDAMLVPEALPGAIAALDRFRGPAFPLRFDRLIERRCVTLRSSKTLAAARRFQKALTVHFAGQGFRWFAPPPTPHVTIRYGEDGRGDEDLAPIGWLVEEVLLIESVVGEGRHIEHGRWRLLPPETTPATRLPIAPDRQYALPF